LWCASFLLRILKLCLRQSQYRCHRLYESGNLMAQRFIEKMMFLRVVKISLELHETHAIVQMVSHLFSTVASLVPCQVMCHLWQCSLI
jgi:hypothetical protein